VVRRYQIEPAQREHIIARMNASTGMLVRSHSPTDKVAGRAGAFTAWSGTKCPRT
jgi:hypothetical protein